MTFSILFAFSWLTDALLFLDKMGRQGQMFRTMDDVCSVWLLLRFRWGSFSLCVFVRVQLYISRVSQKQLRIDLFSPDASSQLPSYYGYTTRVELFSPSQFLALTLLHSSSVRFVRVQVNRIRKKKSCVFLPSLSLHFSPNFNFSSWCFANEIGFESSQLSLTLKMKIIHSLYVHL